MPTDVTAADEIDRLAFSQQFFGLDPVQAEDGGVLLVVMHDALPQRCVVSLQPIHIVGAVVDGKKRRPGRIPAQRHAGMQRQAPDDARHVLESGQFHHHSSGIGNTRRAGRFA